MLGRKSSGLLMALALVALSACGPGACSLSDSDVLPVTRYEGELDLWCWAASGKMIMAFLGTVVDQGAEANTEIPREDCLNNPVPLECDTGGWPPFRAYHFAYDTTDQSPLPWDSVRNQIHCSRKPFAFTWNLNRGGAHMMVAIGYLMANGVRTLIVLDPATGQTQPRLISYDDYVSAPDDHTHSNDYYNVTKD